MKVLDRLYAKAGQWMYINTNLLVGKCEGCASGYRAYRGYGKILTPLFHQIDGRLVRCTAPWFWRGAPNLEEVSNVYEA